MIRDPSDGTVKEKQKSDWIPGGPPAEKGEDEKQRLDKSREWLKDWKGRTGQ